MIDTKIITREVGKEYVDPVIAPIVRWNCYIIECRQLLN